jgi:hypothetical protein
MVNDAKYLFMCILAISMSSLVKSVFLFFFFVMLGIELSASHLLTGAFPLSYI